MIKWSVKSQSGSGKRGYGGVAIGIFEKQNRHIRLCAVGFASHVKYFIRYKAKLLWRFSPIKQNTNEFIPAANRTAVVSNGIRNTYSITGVIQLRIIIQNPAFLFDTKFILIYTLFNIIMLYDFRFTHFLSKTL